MKSKSKLASRRAPRTTTQKKKSKSTAKRAPAAGIRPLRRRRELIADAAGYTGERGKDRSATSGIP